MKAKLFKQAVSALSYGGLCAFVVMLILKLAHVIAWSWWLIFAPLLPLLVVVAALIYVLFKIDLKK